jgi:hypothetical protein
LRNDTVKGPLQPPYDGPFKVIERGDKNFKILINNKNTIVSIDRLKPTFIIPDEIEQQQELLSSYELLIVSYELSCELSIKLSYSYFRPIRGETRSVRSASTGVVNSRYDR